MKTFAILRKPDVFKLWISQVLSSIGDNFYDMAVVWIATQQVGAGAGLVVLAGSVSTIIFGLPGGVLVDRWDRRITMAFVDTTRMLVLLALVGVTLFGEVALWHLAIVTAINVGLNALFQPAIVATVGIVSDNPQEKQAVNALMDVTARLARALAPALVGLLLATTIPRYLFLMDALTFGVSAIAIYSLSKAYSWRPKRQTDVQTSIRNDLVDGWRAMRAHSVISWLLPMKLVVNFVWGLAFVIGIPLLVEAQFDGDPRLYGYIVASYGLGNVISNVIIGNIRIQRRAFVLFGGMVVLGAGFAIIGSATTAQMAMLGAFIGSFGGPMDDIMMLLYIQEDFADEYIGKIYSLRVVLSEIGYSIGVASAAVIMPLLGTPTTIVLSGLLMATCGLLGWMRFGLEVYAPHSNATEQPGTAA